ncbi:carbohydrate sulfotransferase 15 [Oryzias melastigma]|uniref:carbohydrate sulfotransferase 15 n=1 Tax=Oryzias melastigma TaxID=30732 RepID=UPI000CF7E730|nr:carbohydrate sulfotransferase 15 [Oryzias melastigma]
MPTSDDKHGSNTQTDYFNSLQSLSLAVIYGKRSVRTFLDFRDKNAPHGLDVKCAPLSFLTNLRRFSKAKVVSFFLCLTLAFLIMVSYTLMLDKRRMPLMSSYRPSLLVVPTGAFAGEDVSTEKSFMSTELMVKIISSIQEHKPRRVPDKKEITETDSNLFSVIPPHFLPNTKSPCWYEEVSGDASADPYKKNHFCLRSKSFRNTCDRMRDSFRRHLSHRDGKQFRLRCLPYFYIIGQPKCGTTDLFHRLLMHPEVKFNIIKEPHWWTRKRFGYIRFKDGLQERFPLQDYLDLFDLASHNIQEGIRGNSSVKQQAIHIITGEASASTMWDNQASSYHHGAQQETEPSFLVQDFIHAVQPDAKIIVMLRDPVERLYSDYLYFILANKSVEDFHHRVKESVQLFQACLSERSLRSCVYNSSLYNIMPVRLNLGLYFLYVLDWLSVFRRDQILVLRLEDYANNIKETIKKVFDFLKVGPLSAHLEAALTKRPMSNTRRAQDRNLGPMLPATRSLLSRFHQPFNYELARLLNSEAFLWRES